MRLFVKLDLSVRSSVCLTQCLVVTLWWCQTLLEATCMGHVFCEHSSLYNFCLCSSSYFENGIGYTMYSVISPLLIHLNYKTIKLICLKFVDFKSSKVIHNILTLFCISYVNVTLIVHRHNSEFNAWAGHLNLMFVCSSLKELWKYSELFRNTPFLIMTQHLELAWNELYSLLSENWSIGRNWSCVHASA